MGVSIVNQINAARVQERMSEILEDSDAQNGTQVTKVSRSVAEQAMSVSRKTGKAKRRERKLRHEPSNVTAESNPDKLQVMDFLEARRSELNSMIKAVRRKGGSKRTFQKLPRHMRRRAMSHTLRRLPRKLRGRAEKEVSVWFACMCMCEVCYE